MKKFDINFSETKFAQMIMSGIPPEIWWKCFLPSLFFLPSVYRKNDWIDFNARWLTWCGFASYEKL